MSMKASQRSGEQEVNGEEFNQKRERIPERVSVEREDALSAHILQQEALDKNQTNKLPLSSRKVPGSWREKGRPYMGCIRLLSHQARCNNQTC